MAIGTFLTSTRRAKDTMRGTEYPQELTEGISAYLALVLDFVINRNSILCTWTLTRQTTRSTFARFVLPITWDFAEASVLEQGSGGYWGAVDWIARYIDHALSFAQESAKPSAEQRSAIVSSGNGYDLVLTDPPYYDAIPYSDLMDFFYVWLRRTLAGMGGEFDKGFTEPLSPKWDSQRNDGELIDDETRQGGDAARSKAVYEDGMYRAFQACHLSLDETGRLVIVFANKTPNAWETLVSAIIRAGFVVDGSWPIQTEMANRTRALTSAALASSVWLVCKKRPPSAKPGWDNSVLTEMRKNISKQLREFWDAGIRGPDFVWAATGPALEAYSKHPVVKKANDPGSVMTVSEFLTHVRRMVVDFVVGRVLSGDGDAADQAAADKSGRTDRVLPAPPERFRAGRHPGRDVHPVCRFVRPFGQRACGYLGHPRPRRRHGVCVG
jgi:adenine-specific DNA methylase